LVDAEKLIEGRARLIDGGERPGGLREPVRDPAGDVKPTVVPAPLIPTTWVPPSAPGKFWRAKFAGRTSSKPLKTVALP